MKQSEFEAWQEQERAILAQTWNQGRGLPKQRPVVRWNGWKRAALAVGIAVWGAAMWVVSR